VTLKNSRDGGSIHGIHLDVRSGSIGGAGGDRGNSLSRRQQHVRDPAVALQQHWPEVAHVCFDFTPSRFAQGPLARETGAKPDAMIAVNKTIVAGIFGVLRNLNMACVPGQSIYIVRGRAATVQSGSHSPYGWRVSGNGNTSTPIA
jgi:hypothetical protein